LPVAAQPLIQYAVEEAAVSGLETVVLVISSEKQMIAEHFRRDLALEKVLQLKGKTTEMALVRNHCELVDVQVVTQEKPLGLADAIRTSYPLIGEEPFAVILPDVLIDSSVPCVRQLMNCYANYKGCIIASRQIDATESDRFGLMKVVGMADDRTWKVVSLMEKPRMRFSGPLYGIFGRYIMEPEIFSCIEETKPGHSGELQLTDALQLCLRKTPVYGYCFEGKHYDVGNKLDFVKANIEYSLKDPQLTSALRVYLNSEEFVEPESVR
jgi:UTP--glucose-1-phosphate uridylyltransferase